MPYVKIVLPNNQQVNGILIESRTYCRVRDLAEGLGYWVKWFPSNEISLIKPVDFNLETDLRLYDIISATILDKHLLGTPLSGLGEVIKQAARLWSINEIFICAVACHESNFGRSKIAQDKNNLFGYMAFDKDPYGSAKHYDSFEESIRDFCKLISREYLNPAGAFYNGSTVKGVGVKYATDPQWADKVLRHCQAILSLGR